MKIRSPAWLFGALLAIVVPPPEALAQDSYPNRTIRIIVPGAPGGSNDTLARLMAPGLSQRLGQPVVVDNRPGAGTIIGSEIVAKAPPDGYTLLMGVASHAINPAINLKMPYDAVRDFVPIMQTITISNVMAVHPSVPAKTVKELIALAKARPGALGYASTGEGTNSHLAMVLFASTAQVRFLHVPYKGGTPGVIDTIAGNVEVTVQSVSLLLPHVRTGKLRALGVTSAHRVPAAPDIPTIAEAGLPGYEADQWSGLLAPAGTSRDIVARLYKESLTVLRTVEIKERLASGGLDVVTSSPEEFAAFIKSELVKWAKVVKAAGIKPE